MKQKPPTRSQPLRRDDRPYRQAPDREPRRPDDRPPREARDRKPRRPGDRPYPKSSEREQHRPDDRPYRQSSDREQHRPDHRPHRKSPDRDPRRVASGQPPRPDDRKRFVPPPSRPPRPDQEAPGDLMILGRHEVLAALQSDKVPECVYLSGSAHGPGIDAIRQAASRRQVKLQAMDPHLFRRKFGDAAQGVAARAGAYAYAELTDILARLRPGEPAILIALHEVEDPRNLGAVVRTAEVAGARGVIITKHRAAGMTEWALRTAQGAAAHLPVARVTNLSRAIEELKQHGFLAVGLQSGVPDRYDLISYPERVVLVAGGEDAGLGKVVAGVCDRLVGIPVLGRTSSLNLSVSTAVVLFEILRKQGFRVGAPAPSR